MKAWTTVVAVGTELEDSGFQVKELAGSIKRRECKGSDFLKSYDFIKVQQYIL